MKTLFTWLHLSDIHVGHGTSRYKFDQKEVWRKLEYDIRQAVRSRVAPRPDAIFVTGDLAFSGDHTQYSEIGGKLDALARELYIPSTSIYTVPGNHDVQRAVGDEDFKVSFNGLRKTGNIDDALEAKSIEKALTARFHNYLEFTRHYAPSANKLYWFRRLKASRLGLRIVGLNTALLSHDDHDEGELALGLKQIDETLDNIDRELVILLTHHPLSWMRDAAQIEKRLRGLTHIHLHGHVHVSESTAHRAGGGDSWLTICAGAVHAEEAKGDDKPVGHGYSFGAVGVDERNDIFVEIWPRRWSERHDNFRVDVENTDPDRTSTRHVLSRPKAKDVVAQQRHKPHARAGEGGLVFDVDNLDLVIDAIDTDTRRRLEAVEDFLGSVAHRFRKLFTIDEERLELHPLFVDLQRTLESLVPGIVLNEEDGVLKRAHTRHAILRTETMHSILLAVPKEALRQTARRIGKGAASDLIRNVLDTGNYIPATADAFVALWDFWDRTGGWGKLSLASRDEDNGIWNLQISNNFLELNLERKKLDAQSPPEEVRNATDADLDLTHHLCEFWCGYVHGFLEAALPRIRELMLRDTAEPMKRVFIPAFASVESVEHVLPDHDLVTDCFRIQFKIEPLSRAISRLSYARKYIEENPYQGATNACAAVHEASKTFNELVHGLIGGLPAGTPKRKRLERMQASPVPPFDWQTFGEADEWLEDASWVMRELSRSGGVV